MVGAVWNGVSTRIQALEVVRWDSSLSIVRASPTNWGFFPFMACPSSQIATLGRAVPTFAPGVRIPEVLSSSSAARAGFKSRDIILKVRSLCRPQLPRFMRYSDHHDASVTRFLLA